MPATSNHLSASFASPNEHSFFEVADKLCDLYISSRERFVIMDSGNIFIPKKDNVPLRLSNRHVCHHLNHRYAISVFAGNYSSKFITFDVDDGDQNSVSKIIDLIEAFGIPRRFAHVSSSGGKGYHVDVFFDDLVYTDKLAILYDYVIINGKLNPRKIEFRPTHTQAIKLPLSVHHKTGNTCWFLNPDTFDPYLSTEYLFSIEKFPRDKFNDLISICGLRNPITDINNPEFERALNPETPKNKELTPEIEKLVRGSVYPRITEPGQRHALMRSIAIYNRTKDMTKDESREALETWWFEQDRTVTSTSDDEALADIVSLVDWTFSDGFVPPKRSRTLTIDEPLLDIVLAQHLKIERKIMFLVTCFCSAFGSLKMSYARIAEYVGCSELSARNTLKRLETDGWIRAIKGSVRIRNGIFYQETYTYRLAYDAKEKACFELTNKDISHVEYSNTLPYVFESVDIEPESTNEYRKLIVPELSLENFNSLYNNTLLRAVSLKTLRICLTRSEYTQLLNYKNGEESVA